MKSYCETFPLKNLETKITNRSNICRKTFRVQKKSAKHEFLCNVLIMLLYIDEIKCWEITLDII